MHPEVKHKQTQHSERNQTHFFSEEKANGKHNTTGDGWQRENQSSPHETDSTESLTEDDGESLVVAFVRGGRGAAVHPQRDPCEGSKHGQTRSARGAAELLGSRGKCSFAFVGNFIGRCTNITETTSWVLDLVSFTQNDCCQNSV